MSVDSLTLRGSRPRTAPLHARPSQYKGRVPPRRTGYPARVPLIIVGIDEAGYGPLLGPLCVGMAAMEVADWHPGDPAPDLWSLLVACVCRKATDARRRVAVEDSKKLKLANSGTRRHPLTHLERGVLTMLASTGAAASTDDELLAALATRPAADARARLPSWHDGDSIPLPLATSREAIAIDANRLAAGLGAAGVRVLSLGCRVVHEPEFNELVRRWGTKAATTGVALREHLRMAWERWGAAPRSDASEDGAALRVVCDRQGGRTDYTESLARWVPGSVVEVLEETAERSRYLLRGSDTAGAPREMGVHFRPEAESACLPVALASMTAKYVRELQMLRFNRHFAARLPELKPTAGYRLDAARWLRDAGPILDRAERDALQRIA